MKKFFEQKNGFTLVELLIATTVFAVILLVCTTGLVQIGRMYYKGVTQARTQETARTVMDDISRTIQFSNSEVSSPPSVRTESYNGVNLNIFAYCIGELRYSFVIKNSLGDSMQLNANPNGAPNKIRHVLWVDAMTSANATCDPLNLTIASGNPADANTNTNSLNNRELLGEGMRLLKLQINPVPGSKVYNVDLKIGTGDKDLFDATGETCISTGLGGQFCATSQIKTSVLQRVN